MPLNPCRPRLPRGRGRYGRVGIVSEYKEYCQLCLTWETGEEATMSESTRETESAEVELGDKTEEGYRPVGIKTSRGVTATRWYVAPGANAGVIYVGGVGGDFDSPASGMYHRLCRDFVGEGLEGLRVQFRDPTDLDQAAFDVMAGIVFLESQGIARIGLVGHSFGGAVVIRAATVAEPVKTVVAISTQAFGTDVVPDLADDCSLLLLHGADDQVLAPTMSEWVYEQAHEPKELRILPKGSHVLDEIAEQVHAEVGRWLLRELSPAEKG